MSALAAVAPEAGVVSADAYAAELYERHRGTIHRVCLRELRAREDADDAVQMTFVYALLSLRRGVMPQFEVPWLLTIARNVCSTRRRARTRAGEHESPQDLDTLEYKLATTERSSTVTPDDFRSALAEIPESQRRALLLREWQGLSYDEIGSELGLSQAATEALLFRARRNVADRLAPLRPLHGVALVSFLRRFFEGAAAKTLALGAGAALTVAAVPAATPDVEETRARPPAAAAQVVQVQREQAGPPAQLFRPSTGAQERHPVAVHASLPASSNADDKTQVRTLPPPAPQPQPQPQQPASADVTQRPAPPVDPVTTVVDTAADVGVPLNDIPVSLPQLPDVSTALPVEVQPPAPPDLNLP